MKTTLEEVTNTAANRIINVAAEDPPTNNKQDDLNQANLETCVELFNKVDVFFNTMLTSSIKDPLVIEFNNETITQKELEQSVDDFCKKIYGVNSIPDNV